MPKTPVRFVLPSLNGGGAERAAILILSSLSPERYKRTLHLFDNAGHYLNDIPNDIEVVVAPGRSRWARFVHLSRCLRQDTDGTVFSFLSPVTVAAANRFSGNRHRVVVCIQTPLSRFLNDDGHFAGRGVHRSGIRFAVARVWPFVDRVVAASRGTGADLIAEFRLSAAKLTVIPNPVDIGDIRAKAAQSEDWRPPQSGAALVVAAGRLVAQKNYPLLLKAFSILRQTKKVHLCILGEGPLDSELKVLASTLGVADSVTFLGFQRNPWRYMGSADVFVLSSQYEGFGNVLVEAMACGVPVVATASDGSRDIIQDGVNGVLVKEHDPVSLARSISEVLDNEELRSKLATNGGHRAEAFSVAKVSSQYDQLIQELCYTRSQLCA